MFGIDITILALAGLVAFAIGGVLYALFYNRIETETNREKRVTTVAGVDPLAGKAKGDPAASRRKNVQAALSDLEAKQKNRAARSTSPPMKLRLQQAGMKATMPKFILMSILTGIGLFMGGLVMGMPLPVAAGMGFVGAFGLPRFVVNFKRKRRQKAFTDELPNAVEVIVRGVKAGLPLNDCLRMIANEAKEPVRSEFRNIIEAQQLGVPLDEAVGRIYERMPLPEANFFAIVIAIQSKAGGNLSEALGNLAKVLRDRKKMQAKIKAMSSEAKASAGIIGSLPLIVTALVYATSPDYISVLWTDPRGQMVIGGSALVMLAGIFVMRQMINFDF